MVPPTPRLLRNSPEYKSLKAQTPIVRLIPSSIATLNAISTTLSDGRFIIILIFEGSCAVTSSATLFLASAFSATAKDTLTLASLDGTTWYETARSVNP